MVTKLQGEVSRCTPVNYADSVLAFGSVFAVIVDSDKRLFFS